MGSILEVKHTGLGGAAKEIKRHSKIKVTKVSHIVRKVNRKLPKRKETHIERKKTAPKKPKKKIIKVQPKKDKHGYKWNEKGDRIYYD